MKKKIIGVAAVAMVFAASSALAGGPEIIPIEDLFSGFFVGGIGGVNHMSVNSSSNFGTLTPLTFNFPTTSVEFVNPPLPGVTLSGLGVIQSQTIGGPIFNSTGGGGSWNGFGGVQGGFGWVFAHHYYLGVVGSGQWGSQSVSNSQTTARFSQSTVQTAFFDTFDDVGGTVTTSNGAIFNSNTSTSVNNMYTVAGKLGWIFDPATMIYGKVGAAWAKIDINSSFNATFTEIATETRSIAGVQTLTGNFSTANGTAFASSSNSDTKASILLGLGFERFIWRDMLSLNVEYDYTNYGTIKTKPGTTVASGVASTTVVSTLFGPPAVPTVSTPFVVALPNSYQASSHVSISTLLAGLNFYFGRHWL